MGFRLAPREVAPSSSAGWSPVFVNFRSGSPPLGEGLKMMVNEFAFAISTLHFRTLGKCSKAISEVQANGATENTSPKGDPIRPKNHSMTGHSTEPDFLRSCSLDKGSTATDGVRRDEEREGESLRRTTARR